MSTGTGDYLDDLRDAQAAVARLTAENATLRHALAVVEARFAARLATESRLVPRLTRLIHDLQAVLPRRRHP